MTNRRRSVSRLVGRNHLGVDSEIFATSIKSVAINRKVLIAPSKGVGCADTDVQYVAAGNSQPSQIPKLP